MNNTHFEGTIHLRKSITGPRFYAMRPKNGTTRHYADGVLYDIPYVLAMYLMLMPTKDYRAWTQRLYGMTNNELDNLKPDGIIQKVTHRQGCCIVTIKVDRSML